MKRLLFRLLVAAVFLMSGMVAAPTTFAGHLPGRELATTPPSVAQWTSSGPYASDATAVAVSPAFDSDHTVFLGVSQRTNDGQVTVQATAAILRSTDAGATWTTVWSHTSAQGITQAWLNQIVVSPSFATDRTVFALWADPTGGDLLRSTDGGASFQKPNVGTNGFSPTSKTISISPAFGTDFTVAVTADLTNVTTSYLSTDGGTTWHAVTVQGPNDCTGTPLPGGGYVLALGNGTLGSYLLNNSVDCSFSNDQMYAASSDNGQTWTKRGDIQAAIGGLNNWDTQHSRLYAAPDGSAILYTDQYGNAVRSADGGQTWLSLIGVGSVLGHDSPPGSASATGPDYTFQFQSASSVYAVHEWTKLTGPHLYHSGDGGATWTLVWQGAGSTAQHGIAAGGASSLFFAAGNEGLLRSTDLGQTWQPVGAFLPQMPAVALSPNFATDHNVFTVTFPDATGNDGQDSDGFGIYRSTSGGATWSEPQSPTPANGSGFGTIFTTSANGGMSLAVSPNFANDHTVFEGDRIGAVAISHDAGHSWTTSLPGTPPQEGWFVNALSISPNFATDHVVYWGGGPGGFGVFKSVDGGQTWGQVTPLDRINEVSASIVHGLATSAEPTGTLDTAIAMGQLFLMQDNPSSTTRVEWADTGLVVGAGAVAMSPNYQHDCTIYASMWPGPQGISATLDDGVYVSTNACIANANAGTVTWTRLTGGLPVRDFDTIALSPNFAQDHTLFIGSYSSGVSMSTDGGQTWSPFSAGLGNLTVHQLSIAATGPQAGMLFAATDGGVWQTPVALTIPTGPVITSTNSGTNQAPGGTAVATIGGTAGSPGSIAATAAGTGTVTLASYSGDPAPSPPSSSASNVYSDVKVAPGSTFTSVTVQNCSLAGGTLLYWFDGSVWRVVSAQAYNPGTFCITATFTASTSPTVSQLSGTVFGAAVGVTEALPLSAGWHLLALSVQPPSTAITDVLGPIIGQYDVVFGFDPSQGGVTSYFTDPSKVILNNLSTLQPPRGYWLHTTGVVTLTLAGTPLSGASIALAPGWNLVGYTAPTSEQVGPLEAEFGQRVDVIFGFDPTQGGVTSYFTDPSKVILNNLSQLQQNNGYWLHLTGSGAAIWSGK